MIMALQRRSRPKDPNLKEFEYIAISGISGARVKARMAAPRASIVSTTLQAEGFVPIVVREVDDSGLNFDIGARFARPYKMKTQQLAAFSRQLHQLLKAGLPVARALQALGAEQDPRLTQILDAIADRTASGFTLSTAMKDYPRLFDDVFVSYIAAGEETGEMVATTARLAKMLERRAALQGKIKSVTAYPKMVSSAVGVIVVGILLFLVPRFQAIYASFGAKLPGPTQALVDLSKNMNPFTFKSLFPSPMSFVGIPLPRVQSPVIWMIVAFLLARWFMRANRNNLEFGTALDKVRFRLPIFGSLASRTAMYRWSSTLAGALQAGMQLMPALELAGRATGSGWHMRVANDLKAAVRSGRSLSAGLDAHSALFPATVRSMVSTGESAGELSQMLESVAEAIDDEIDVTVTTLGSRLEVVLLMVMGVVVGGLLMVLYLPIINLASAASSGAEQAVNVKR